MELLTEHLGHGLALTLLLSLPCVLTAAGIGLVVGILQAVTQVQEQTIAAAPKIVGVFLIILLGGGLMMNLLTGYLRESAQIAFNEIPQDGLFVRPPKTTLTAGQRRAREFFRAQSGGDAASGDKLKALSRPWEFNTETGQAAVLKVPGRKKGAALDVAERMALDKDKKSR